MTLYLVKQTRSVRCISLRRSPGSPASSRKQDCLPCCIFPVSQPSTQSSMPEMQALQAYANVFSKRALT